MHPTFCKVTINICALGGPTNIKSAHATNKDIDADKEVSYEAQPQGQTFLSSHQVSPSNTYPFQYRRMVAWTFFI